MERRELAPAGLTEREQVILALRFWPNVDGSRPTLQEIGQYYAVSKERVRQLEERALKKLLTHLDLTWDDVGTSHIVLRRLETWIGTNLEYPRDWPSS